MNPWVGGREGTRAAEEAPAVGPPLGGEVGGPRLGAVLQQLRGDVDPEQVGLEEEALWGQAGGWTAGGCLTGGEAAAE